MKTQVKKKKRRGWGAALAKLCKKTQWLLTMRKLVHSLDFYFTNEK